MHIHLPWSSPLLLALGTWLIYVADRILDVLGGGASGQLRERHFFYARHRAPALAVGAFASLALLWLFSTRMNPAARREDVVLFAAALVYFCLIHVWAPQSPSGIERWFPKEIAVAVVFASAVAVPAWSRLPSQRVPLAPLVALFALLCWLNCVAIEKWENWESPVIEPRPGIELRTAASFHMLDTTPPPARGLRNRAAGRDRRGVIDCLCRTRGHDQPLSRLHRIGSAVPRP